MKRSSRSDRHLDVEAALDYLEMRLEPAARLAADEHLGRPCSACRERVRALGELLETMRLDRTAEVPESLRASVLALFTPSRPAGRVREAVEALADLVFDSWSLALPGAARRSVGEARRLRFALHDSALELEVERESGSTITLRGRLGAPDSSLYDIEVRVRDERRVARPDARGAFSLEGVPVGVLDVTLTGPAGQFRLPPIEG